MFVRMRVCEVVVVSTYLSSKGSTRLSPSRLVSLGLGITYLACLCFQKFLSLGNLDSGEIGVYVPPQTANSIMPDQQEWVSEWLTTTISYWK